MELTPEEKKAVTALKRLAKTWPPSLWLFSASGNLCVMKLNENGERAEAGDGYDQEYVADRIGIPNDGGDW